MTETLVLESTFQITNRGLVLATQQWSGTIRVGQCVLLPDGRGGVRADLITGVETGRRVDDKGNPVTWIGLLLGEVPDGDIESVRARLRPGDVLTIDERGRDA